MLDAVTGGIEKPFGAINSKTIFCSNGLAKYCMKGIDPFQAKAKHIRHEYQGVVFGKRCGVSESLGPAARCKFRAIRRAA